MPNWCFTDYVVTGDMKYKITIEETVSQDFVVEAGSVEEARKVASKKYRDCEFVLELGELVETRVWVRDERASDDCGEAEW